jgi:23S rRNA (cytidine1920-2'-O)/16S rRNA (cytidine1409-2'-O)-methyltransferase
VKPQFEAGREAVEKGGIVRDDKVRADTVVAVAEHFAREGAGVIAVAASRVAGREGNREIFVHAVKGEPGLATSELRAAADRAAA